MSGDGDFGVFIQLAILTLVACAMLVALSMILIVLGDILTVLEATP